MGAPFVNPDSVRTTFTQTADVLALRFGLVPESLRAATVRHLADDVAAHGWHLTTGFLGSAYILPVLSDDGHRTSHLVLWVSCSVEAEVTSYA